MGSDLFATEEKDDEGRPIIMISEHRKGIPTGALVTWIVGGFSGGEVSFKSGREAMEYANQRIQSYIEEHPEIKDQVAVRFLWCPSSMDGSMELSALFQHEIGDEEAKH